ncbi:MAG TPA: DUF1846 domain-containing protein [bacterium]|nr:DUF1846 domain-containing protein [bacterium]HPP29985.1 DUF1846 domain-containing protein [bacterium]
MKKIGFDNEKYLKEQSKAILERINLFKGKLYLEFGGKLLYDYHAARVLPGYDHNIKIKLLQQLKDKIDIILCIYAGDIVKGRIRGDFGITYDADALKLIDSLREYGLDIKAVVITRFENQPSVLGFKNKLEHRGVKVYLHTATKGYPTDVNTIVSEEGYGKNSYIETEKPIIVVTGPGPGSGKLATCLSQLYHDYKRGIKSGYAKFETFPVWNLPLKHPVNVAYEAATADLDDINMIDPYHLSTYKESAVNYNRDIELFPVLQRILKKIMGNNLPYHSPTDMGVNRIGFAIIDDDVVKEAAKQEIIRRYFRYNYEYRLGVETQKTLEKIILLMEELNLKPEDRSVVEPARDAAEKGKEKLTDTSMVCCGAALQTPDGTIITGHNSELMTAASSVVLNAIKHIAEIPDKIHLLSSNVIEHIKTLKGEFLELKNEVLDLEETLIALSISATNNPTAEMAMEKLKDLKGCEVHLTHIPSPGDEIGLRRLKVNLTVDANFPSRDLFLGQ